MKTSRIRSAIWEHSAYLIIILVFIVMAAQFESLTYPFILILSVPFAMSGVLMALFITDTTLSVMSSAG